jgi:hypothetical protein
MHNHSMNSRPRNPLRTHGVAPAPVASSLRLWCLTALKSAPGSMLSLDRLRDICRGTAAAEGETDVEPIDAGRVALALLGDADWEIVCRPSRARRRSY